MIGEVKNVEYIMSNVENPWDTFDNYLIQNNIEPEEASGVQFYLYLLQCIQVAQWIGFHSRQTLEWRNIFRLISKTINYLQRK